MAQSVYLRVGYDGRLVGGKRVDGRGRPEIPMPQDGWLSVAVDCSDWLGTTTGIAAAWEVLSGGVTIRSSSLATSRDKAIAVFQGNQSGEGAVRLRIRNSDQNIGAFNFSLYPVDTDIFSADSDYEPAEYAILFLLADGATYGDLGPDFTADPFELPIILSSSASGIVEFDTNGIPIGLAGGGTGLIELEV